MSIVRKPPRIQFDHASLDDAKAVGRTINRIQDATLNTVDQLVQQANRLGSPDGTTLTNNSAGDLSVTNVTAIAPNTSVVLKGNRSAGSFSADILSTTSVTRTAGSIHGFQNNGATQSWIDNSGNLGLFNATLAQVYAANTNMPLTLQGNRNATDPGADVTFRGSTGRTAGLIAEFYNSTQKATVDYLGNFHGQNTMQRSFAAGGQTITSTTPVNVTGVSFPVAANATYEFEAYVTGSGPNGVTSNVIWSIPSGVTSLQASCWGERQASGTAGSDLFAAHWTQAGLSITFIFTSNLLIALTMRGTITTGATNGNVQLQMDLTAAGTITITGTPWIKWSRMDSGGFA